MTPQPNQETPHQVPIWPIQSRHSWMATRLRNSRMKQAGAHDESAMDAIRGFYDQHCSQILGINSKCNMFEILSDGLLGPEPYWHGLLFSGNRHKLEILSEEYHQELWQRVREMRLTLAHEEHLFFPTHHEIGSVLAEPVLFQVSGDKVTWFKEGGWRDLSDSDHQLPFRDGTPLPETEKIKRSLVLISRRVLWPTFFPRKYAPDDADSYLSLVFIQASHSHVYGIWNLHATRITSADAPKPSAVDPLIEPPVRCLLDVLGAAYLLDNTHTRREANVKLFSRSIGRSIEPGEGYDRQEYNNVYFRDLSADTEQLRHLYRYACAYFASKPNTEAPAEHYGWMDRALEGAYIAWHLEGDQQIAGLILQEAVRLCIAVADKLRLAVATAHPPDGLLQTLLSDDQFDRAEEWLRGEVTRLPHTSMLDHLSLARLLALAVTALSLLEPATAQRQDAWLRWFATGFRSLLLSVDPPSNPETSAPSNSLPSNQQWMQWESNEMQFEPDVDELSRRLIEVLTEDKLPAVWCLIEVIRRSG